MSKHMAKRGNKTAKHRRAARPLKVTRNKKSTRVKKAIAQQDQVIGKSAIEQHGLESDAAELQLVDFEALGQQPEVVADVVEVYEVEVVSDAEGIGQSEEPELTLEDID